MNEIWRHIEAFFEILSTRNVLIEVGVLAELDVGYRLIVAGD